MDTMDVSQGIISLVTSNMARAIRVVSVRKGYDPRDFTLVAFGGAGPLHAARLAKELNIPRVLVPEVPGILCALGLLVTDIRSDYTLTRIMVADKKAATEVKAIFRELEASANEWLNHEGVQEKDRLYRYSVDIRYRGQNYELKVPLEPGDLIAGEISRLIRRFHLLHEQNYGYFAEEEPTQLVTFCLEAVGCVPRAALNRYPKDGPDSQHALESMRRVFLEEAGGFIECPVYRREALQNGNVISGPAILEQMDSTTLILPGQEAVVDHFRNIIIHIFGQNSAKGAS